MDSGPSGSAKPFRQLPHHALVGERQHVGEGEGGGIAGARLLADASAVDDRDRTPALGEIGRGRDADDPGPDDGDVDARDQLRAVRRYTDGRSLAALGTHDRLHEPAAAPAASPARPRSTFSTALRALAGKRQARPARHGHLCRSQTLRRA